jgi:sulfide dehydrogenase [flavocytochrome c] flavoprotein subunit
MRRRAFLRLTVITAAGALQPGWSAAPAAGAAHAKVLIIGGGFAGSACALRLRRLNPALEITLVDPDAIYTCCPMSNGVLVGQRGMQSLRVSRQGLQRSGVRYVLDRVVGIDARRRRARLSGGGELAYDRLVFAAGIRFLWNRPEGYTEAATARMPHAWQAGAQTELLAAQLRAMDDGGVIAISVPAGPMRCPPGPFERASLFADYLHRDKPRSKILIFDANNHFPRQDQFLEAWRSLYPGMIEWISVVDGGALQRVDPQRMLVIAASQEYRVGVANIIPPQAPSMLAVAAGLASDHGWCPVNPLTFESTLVPNAHVIGDSCIADPMPKSASAACSQATQCAASIAASLAGRELPAAELDSVCYSSLSADTALSIHGRFRATAAGMEQLPSAGPASADALDEAGQAVEWYRRTLTQAFAVRPGERA